MSRRRLAGAVVVAVLVAGTLGLGASTALAQVTLSQTTDTLPGSNFQGGNGDQVANPNSLIDWQDLEAAGKVGRTMDLPSGQTDDSFVMGSKENEPGNCFPAGPHSGSCWNLTSHSVPPKDDILDIYRSFEHVPGHDAFLYLALTRGQGTGDTFLTFELNQKVGPNPDGTWTNAAGSHIPCRETGDLLITLEVHGTALTVHIDEWVTNPVDAVDTHTGCALVGKLQAWPVPPTPPPDNSCAWSVPRQCDVQGAFNNRAIDNYLPGQLADGGPRPIFPAAGSTIATGEFAEVAVNLTQILSAMGEPACSGRFASTWAHSRSAEADSSEMKDYVAPEPFLVRTCRATPALSSKASSSVPLGSPIFDTAGLRHGDHPTGTMTFHLYGPGDSTCSSPIFTTTRNDVRGNGPYTSSSFMPTRAGTYRWRVTYSGDANNDGAGPTGCHQETVRVTRAQPAFMTVASPATVLPNPINDSAWISGFRPRGTIKFEVFAPDDTGCTGTPADTSTVHVTGKRIYISSDFTPTSAGTWRWIAMYSGDRNNRSVATLCNDPGESTVVTGTPAPGKPALTTTATPGAPAGSPIADIAHLTGGSDPTGTITFYVYGPNDSTCAGTPAAPPSTVTVSGAGSYTSAPFTPTDPGTYDWVASYSGDAGNAPVATACGESGETSVVSKADPGITTSASPSSVPNGGSVGDTAVLTGGADPRGTITFRLYGPGNGSCSGPPAFVVEQVVIGNGSYPSPMPGPTLAGTYRWVATYSGDARNNGASTHCGDPGETVVVGPPPPIKPIPDERTPKPKSKTKAKSRSRPKRQPPFTG